MAGHCAVSVPQLLEVTMARRTRPKEQKTTATNLAELDAHVIQPEEYEDIPELTVEWFEQADLHHGGKLIRRGRRPQERKE
jgi:hypothetical protein